MIRHARRTSSICSTVLMTGAALALATAGCGGGSSGGGTGGTSGKNDAAQLSQDLPSAMPEVGKDLPSSTGGAAGGPEVGAGGAGGRLDSGAGGAGGVDATPATGGTGGFDGGGTGGTVAIDAADASVDTVPIDGSGGPYTCRTPAKAWVYPVAPMNTVSFDSDGSLITASTFYMSTPQFVASPGGIPTALKGNGSSDILVTKLDPSTGNPTWVFTAGDLQDQNITGAAATSAGVGVLGTFMGTLEIVTDDPIVNPKTALVDFIAGLKDVDGTGVWSKKVDLGGGKLVAIAGQQGKDFFVVCGSAMNAAAGLVAGGTAGGGMDVVVAAVKASDGTILWAKLFGGAMDQACSAAAIDDDGNAIFAGTYAGALDFGSGALSPAPTGAQDGILWVAKLNGSTGATIAAKSFGTANRVMPYGVAADAQGNVLVTGSFSTTAVAFGSTVLTPLSATSSTTDAFVAKLDSSLAPTWARRWGGAVATGKGVAVDSSGMVTAVGLFRGTADVGPGTAVVTSAVATVLETFIVTLDGHTGETLCAHSYGDSASRGGGAFGVAVNRWATGAKQDTTLVVGSFTVLIDFGPPTTALSYGSVVGGTYLLRM